MGRPSDYKKRFPLLMLMASEMEKPGANAHRAARVVAASPLAQSFQHLPSRESLEHWLRGEWKRSAVEIRLIVARQRKRRRAFFDYSEKEQLMMLRMVAPTIASLLEAGREGIWRERGPKLLLEQVVRSWKLTNGRRK